MRRFLSLRSLPIVLSLVKLISMRGNAGANGKAVAVWYQRMITEGTTLIGLAIATGITASALIISFFFGGYILLRQWGLEPLGAVGVVAAVALVAIGGLIAYTIKRLRAFRQIPLRLEGIQMESGVDPVTDLFTRAGSVAEAFMDGLRNTDHANPRNGSGYRDERPMR